MALQALRFKDGADVFIEVDGGGLTGIRGDKKRKLEDIRTVCHNWVPLKLYSMHVTVDASPLLLQSAGVKNYLYYWLTHLVRHQGSNQVNAFPLLGETGALNHEASMLSRLETIPRLALLYWANLPGAGTMNWLSGAGDFFHATNQVRHAPKGLRLTATLFDMTCWLMPELHTTGNVTAEKRFAGMLKQARGLISISENTRQDAIRLLGLDGAKIVTIYPGIPEAFFAASSAEAKAAALRYGLTKPFVLAVGTVEPRKNLDTLLDAYQQLPRHLAEAFELVLVGPMGWASVETMRRIRGGLGGVKYLGYVPEADLPAITKAAALFAYPSLYEGFGLPVAQAMACGVPVVTSATSCLPEISGSGAMHVDPRSASELAGAMAKLLESADRRDDLGRSGQAIAAEKYRWDRNAELSWKFFQQMANS